MKQNLFSALLKIAGKAKPLLVRILPINMLRGIKKLFVNSAMSAIRKGAEVIPFNRYANRDGVNLIGHIKGETGLGQSCRLVADALSVSAADFSICNYSPAGAARSTDNTWAHKISEQLPYNVNIFHINPHELSLAYINIGKQAWDCRYNIAFWLWELETFPHEWLNALELADEIWTPSEFASESIKKVTDKPVFTIPYGLCVPDTGGFGRGRFDLPEDVFLFLCMFDSNSVMERKNPLGAIKAYKKAFSENNKNVGLVVKAGGASGKDMALLRKELAGYQNIFILNGTMMKTEVNGLISCVDAYISLHRAEGFGLVCVEAMLLGTPVVATDWSANAEFMHKDVACMVEYKLAEIKKDIGPYRAGWRWAEPCADNAALHMKNLYENSDYRKKLAENAKLYILERFAPEKMAALINSRIADIYGSTLPS